MGKEEKLKAYICRCEGVTAEDIDKAIEEGFRDIESIKRRLRIGMGPCQGRYCIPLVISYMARRLGVKPEEIGYPRVRAPIEPIPAKMFLAVKRHEV